MVASAPPPNQCFSRLPLILDKGEAICLNMGSKEHATGSETNTPFGKAFYGKEAPFFVFPYTMIVVISATMTMISAMYWSIGAVVSAQGLRHLQIHLRHFQLFAPRWYRCGIIYALIAICFMVILTVQGSISFLWVIATKWVLMGRRTPGRYDWDQSSYCQRWQLHLILSRLMFDGFGYGGVLAPLTGSAYIVWYFRALGATIGENCGVWVGGNPGLMTEPDLVEVIIFWNCSFFLQIFDCRPADWRRYQLGRLLRGCPSQFSRQIFVESSQDRGPVCHAIRIEVALWGFHGR